MTLENAVFHTHISMWAHIYVFGLKLVRRQDRDAGTGFQKISPWMNVWSPGRMLRQSVCEQTFGKLTEVIFA